MKWALSVAEFRGCTSLAVYVGWKRRRSLKGSDECPSQRPEPTTAATRTGTE